jgi:hypothetical protein
MKTIIASLTLLLVVSQANAQSDADQRAKTAYIDACVGAILKGLPDKPKAEAIARCEQGYTDMEKKARK